ncbi:MAG: reverse transcriptase family protein, partial [Candidatus Omnitrophica bacterium]|nr:reverse transcriptase family protein [Candidatus Omnitrophota bacterium]
MALKMLKMKKAPGPDKIRNEMIRHLGTTGKQVLLKFINKTWADGQLPKSWRTATIVPVLKTGKPPSELTSYRPISLTSCIGKLVERMVNSRLYCFLETNKLLNSTQAGFRKGCRTEDQLFRLVQNCKDGFQKENPRHTTAVFIDLQQAYDRVWRKDLFIKMHQMGIQGKMFNWIRAFLTNRTISTQYEGATSSKRTLEEGLPQGSALSCTLFLIFINDLTKYLKVSTAMFADDLVIWTTQRFQWLARIKLNQALLTIANFCNLWKLRVNSSKTVYTVFSTSPTTAKKPLSLRFNGNEVRKEETPVYLGVTLDRELKMTRFMETVKEKATKRLNLLKRLASTTWG